MIHMGLLRELLIVWAIVTSCMIVLLIYRSTLGAHEDNQLYLGQAESMLRHEQEEIIKKEKKLAPFLYVFGTVSGVLLLSIVAVWIWQGLLMT